MLTRLAAGVLRSGQPAQLHGWNRHFEPGEEPDDATAAGSETVGVEPREPAPAQGQEPAETDDEPELADYTRTHLCSWARAHGLTNRVQVEERIGRPIEGLGPRDIRQLLLEAGVPL